MSSSLVYLHIPKSTGTSHRVYLAKVFGEDQLFWYGLHSDATEFDANKVAAYCTLGGHRPLAFYPRSLNALYTSVVRDPVERAVSFFNYCAEAPESDSDVRLKQRRKEQKHWRRQGLDPTSLSRSIECCKPFRKAISNLQCGYLSRYEPTFGSVLKTLEEESMVIGVFDKLPLFNDFLQTELNFPIENRVHANAGREGYAANIFSEPGVANLIRSLNVEDQLLYDFFRFERAGIYVGVNNVDVVRKNVPTIESRKNLRNAGIPFRWDKVHLFGKGFLGVADDGTLLARVVISNTSNESLVFSRLSENSCSIGWRVMNETGGQIEDLRGTVDIDQTIPAGDIKIVSVSLRLNGEELQNDTAAIIEFCIVDGGVWLNQEYPLTSAVSKLFFG